MARVALYGGSFNPPHVAHLLATTWVLATAEVDEVLVVPTFAHPFGKTLAPYEDRYRMCELAMGWIPGVTISRVEADLGGESRTLRTLEHLKAIFPANEWRLVIGADVVHDAPKWHAFDAIVALAPPLVMGRAGVELEGVQALLPEISSTAVRAAIGAGGSALEPIRPLVPRRVLEYALAHGLYAESTVRRASAPR